MRTLSELQDHDFLESSFEINDIQCCRFLCQILRTHLCKLCTLSKELLLLSLCFSVLRKATRKTKDPPRNIPLLHIPNASWLHDCLEFGLPFLSWHPRTQGQHRIYRLPNGYSLSYGCSFCFRVSVLLTDGPHHSLSAIL